MLHAFPVDRASSSVCVAAPRRPLIPIPLRRASCSSHAEVKACAENHTLQDAEQGQGTKSTLLDEVRQCRDDYKSAYVINAQNMRNTALKEVRARLQGSRLFFGRTKLLASRPSNRL